MLVKDLIKELQGFENQDAQVAVSIDTSTCDDDAFDRVFGAVEDINPTFFVPNYEGGEPWVGIPMVCVLLAAEEKQ